MKGNSILFTWTSLLILSDLQYSGTNSCLHDDLLKEKDIFPKIRYSDKVHYNKKVKRHNIPRPILSKIGKSIRIQPVYFLSKHLLEEEKLALQNVLQRALTKIESLLSVIKSIDGPLLLERKSGCPIVLRKGINKGKCSRIQKGYTGEYCLDKFKIPSSHLKGLAIFDKSNPEPAKVYKTDGVGLNNTDFVLYVTSKTTPLCNPHKSSALAYAAACQLDGSGRPIAGQVNFCPRTLKAPKFDEELLYKTAVHELFHALGFSNKLFEKFISCDEDGKCNPLNQPLVRSANGVHRLVTPAVVREMKKHFNCESEMDFGGPLQLVNGKISSHWDSALMHSSIMTAREQKPHLTLIDPITLAVFEDSGWYKVDYSHADPFIWGKGKGCQFGIQKKCKKNDGFCSNNSTGCHHLRLSKAKCNGNVHQSRCGVFTADQIPCFTETNKTSEVSDDETFSSTSRCFMSSLVPVQSSQIVKPKEMTGRCYESKCEANNVYVRVQSGEWTLCHPGSKVQIDNFSGVIECPPVLEICTSFHIPDIPLSSLTASPVYNISENIGHSRPVRSQDNGDEVGKASRLFADIKLSRHLDHLSSQQFERSIVSVLKENKLGFIQLSTSTESDRMRFCLRLSVLDGKTMHFLTAKKLFYKGISSYFNGYYDRFLKVAVLTSDCYFCRPRRRKHEYRPGCGVSIALSVRSPPSIFTFLLILLVYLCM